MSLAPEWRTRLFATAGALLAVALGVQIAHESIVLPAVCAAALATLIVISIQPYSVTTLLLAGAFVGYIVGNRRIRPNLGCRWFSILPAELVLLAGGTILVVQCAWRRELPVFRDAVNVTLLIWMAIGTSRLFFGVREHGFTAIRDYALVYYGLFFLPRPICCARSGRRTSPATLCAARVRSTADRSSSLLAIPGVLCEHAGDSRVSTDLFRR